ncbi:hypothetical protein Tco_0726329 [Tanacetum coccineum]|uniref:Uncharacterized protein n=1 Tax=Tanacetum coccineum TaxID=301880 RepID=A0ABQ4YGX6_9ASTR
MYPTHTKIINSTIGDDQIDNDIIFDSPNGNVNSGSIEKDTHVPDLFQKQNTTLNSQLELYKERVQVLENINGDNNYLNEFLEANKRAKHFSQQAQSQFVRDRDIIQDLEKQRDKLDLDVKDYKRQNEELQKTHSILKRQMSENEDRYHDTVLDLEAKLKKNVDLILKLGNSLHGMFMLGPKLLSVYDQQLKHGLGYLNPYTLKQGISQCPKLYLASSLGNSEISLNIRDTEDTLDDASKNIVPQKELSAEQKYFPSSFIPSDKNSNATPSILASMPNNSLNAEVEQLKKKSIEIQEGLQTRIKILEKDIKNINPLDYSWISKMEKLKDENVSLDFTVQSLINKQGPSTSGNQEQENDYDFWTESYASDDDEIPTKQMSQDIMKEVSLTIDEAKLKKMVDEMLRQRCTSGDEHQYHIDQMKNFLKSDIVWESRKKILLYWELGHEHKFITEIVARSSNECHCVGFTEPDYKNLNKNDIEDMYLLIMNGKVPDYAETGLLWSLSVFIRSSVLWEWSAWISYIEGVIQQKNSKKEKRVMRHSEIHKFCDATLNKVLEGLRSFNNDVKYGYIQRDLTNEEVEYLKLFEEEIEV